MSIEEIPADEVMTMTDQWHRAFKATGCDPICHCCLKELPPDTRFKLATVNIFNAYNPIDKKISTKEVMLCDTCSVEDMNNMADEKKREYERLQNTGSGCFRINGKIVH